MKPTKVTVTRYCSTCKRTTKTELTMRGTDIVAVRCLSSKHRVLCRGCEASLTSADREAGECTQCGHPVK